MARRLDIGSGLPDRPGILVADGIPTNRLVLRSILENAGCRVDLVGSGLDALAAVQNFGYDLTIVDIALPDLDGLALIRCIRALPEPGCRMAVLAISANPLTADRRLCLAAGADDCLTKPFRCADLKAAVAGLLADAGGAGLQVDLAPPADAMPADAMIEPLLDAEVLSRLGGDLGPEALAGVLVTFTQDMGIRLHRIAAAAASANLRTLVFESHAVSSCCRPLGARRLVQLCGTLESAALSGDCGQALSLACAIGAVAADTLSALSGHGAAA